MKRNLLVITVLALTIGFSSAAFTKGVYKLEAFSQLSPETQTLIVETMKNNKMESRELRTEMREARKDMKEALTAPEFDEVKFQESADRLNELRSIRSQIMTDSVKELAPQLSPEEREVLANMFNRRGYRHGGKNYSGKK